MSRNRGFIIATTSAAVLSATLLTHVPAQASDTGAFVGGMLTSRVLGNMRQRTEQQQAYYAQQSAQQQQVQQAAPVSATKSTEQKLDELNKLAAGGYITPEEY